jgi:hypothetical protein
MSEVGGRKENIKLINYNLKQKNRRGSPTHRYGMVKIPRADPTEYLAEMQGQVGEESDVRLEQRTNK